MCEGPATGGSLLFKQIKEAVRPGPPPTKAFSRLKHPQAEISQQLPARCSRFSPQWPLHSFSKVSLILSFSVPALGLHFLQSKQLEIHVCCLSLIPQLGCIFWGHKVDSRVATVKQLKLKKSIVLFGSVEDRVGAPVGDSLSENSVLWNCTLTADHRALVLCPCVGCYSSFLSLKTPFAYFLFSSCESHMSHFEETFPHPKSQPLSQWTVSLCAFVLSYFIQAIPIESLTSFQGQRMKGGGLP